jgi:hypothetical protein
MKTRDAAGLTNIRASIDLSLCMPTLKILQGHRKWRGTNDAEDIPSRRAGAARIIDWLPVWLSGSGGSHPAGPPPCSRLLTCIGFKLNKGLKPLATCWVQALRDHFEDRNWRLTCGNVELRGLEPLASCMPCKSGCSLTRPDMAPACDYRVWKGLE